MSEAALTGLPNSQSDGESVDLATMQFRTFYVELSKMQRVAAKASEANAASIARTASANLLQLIELQTLATRRLGGRSGQEIETDARFLKAALADELMLNLQWPGRLDWHQVLLESKLFNSGISGDKVFDDIDRLLMARDPGDRNRARLYLHVLALGFQGRYRGSADAGEVLADYRRDLFQFVYQRAADLSATGRTVSAQAYLSTLSYVSAKRFRRFSRWTVWLLAAALLLLTLSEALWIWQSLRLRIHIVLPQAASVAGQPKSGTDALEQGPC